jgi:ornithine cyclodeaminase/alanine dehydrogenase-like protein (mu-crystallin family)
VAGPVRVLRREEVLRALDLATCIDALEPAFAAFATGAAETPGVIHLDVPDAGGEVHVKAGYLHGEPVYAVKVASGFAREGEVVSDGLVVVFDATDGHPAAVLLDGGAITDLRTAAAGGLAARHLAAETVDAVAVIGTGVQARLQTEALAIVRPGLRRVRVWGRRPHRARALAEALEGRLGAGVEVDVAPSVPAAVEGADVVLTCTAAREPLVEAAWVREGAHVTAVGSDAPGKQELDPALLRRADRLVVDSRDQCRRLGELQHAPDQVERAVELGAICAGREPGRTFDRQLTVCDLTGVGVQDVAAAAAVLARAGDAEGIWLS